MGQLRQSFQADALPAQTQTWEEVATAAQWAVRRRLRGQKRAARKGVYDYSRTPDTDLDSIAAEMLVAKLHNVYYTDTAEPDYDGDVITHDGTILQVRQTVYSSGHLNVYREDDPAHTFVLVFGRSPWLQYVGWVPGREAKQLRYWTTQKPNGDPLKQPAFWIPRCDLRAGLVA